VGGGGGGVVEVCGCVCNCNWQQTDNSISNREREERRKKGGEKRKRASPSKENRRRCDDTALHCTTRPAAPPPHVPTSQRICPLSLSLSVCRGRGRPGGGRAEASLQTNQPRRPTRAPAANRQNFDIHRPLLRRTLATLATDGPDAEFTHPLTTSPSPREREREEKRERGKRRDFPTTRPNEANAKKDAYRYGNARARAHYRPCV
jgi:hypothetical protein